MKKQKPSLFTTPRLGDALLLILLGMVLLGFPLLSASAQEFTKPDDNQLRQMLTPLQYAVTQNDKTEPPYRNPFWDEKAPGIYVDVVSGEALFSINMTAARVGPASPARWKRKPLLSAMIGNYLSNALRCVPNLPIAI